VELVVLCTTPHGEEAQKIADLLVETRVCACVNIISGVSSVFFWEGKKGCEKESLLFIKTTSKLYDKLEKTIKENHPYKTPEIIALPIIKGSSDYLEWIRENCKECK